MIRFIALLAILITIGFVTMVCAAEPTLTWKHVQLKTLQSDGLLFVDTCIGEVCGFNFILDSGAGDVSVPQNVLDAMRKDGIITDRDIKGRQTYITADGRKIPGIQFRIPKLRIGDVTVYDVEASSTVGSENQDMMLLGQTFLRKFKMWAVDNRSKELLLSQ